MQSRERTLAIIVALLVGIWLADSLLLQPLSQWFQEKDEAITALERDMNEAQIVLDRRQRIRQEWRSRHASGLLHSEEHARFTLQEMMNGAAIRQRLQIDNIGAQSRAIAHGDEQFLRLNVSLSARGSLRSVQAFLQELEETSMPLSIERCEVASLDPKKDELQLNASVSTLLLSAQRRAQRTLPEDVHAWQAQQLPEHVLEQTVRLKPFLAERRQAAPLVQPTSVVKEQEPLPPPDPGTWALVGVVRNNDVAQVFVRHTKRAEEKICIVGDQLDHFTIAAIDQGSVTLRAAASDAGEAALPDETEAQQRVIQVGQTFDGKAAGGLTTAVPASSGNAAPAAGGSPSPAGSVGDAQRKAILERLRQRRSRKE